MDVCESRKHTAVDIIRPPLIPAERNSNAATTTTRRSRTREISSRYKSPTPSPTVSRRSPSPSLSRSLPTNPQVLSKRSLSAERRRPSTPPSPPSPSTPVKDSSVDTSSRRLSTGARLHESLWPSTMRSLNVSFQSDSVSITVSKKEKPVSNISSDRTLRSSSNVTHKHGEMPVASRNPTPERKRSPLKGKNAQEQSENAKPVDSSHSRLIDQHRWPSRIGGKLSVNPLNRSVDLADMTARASAKPTGTGLPSLRRMTVSDGRAKPLQKSTSDAARLSSLEEFGRVGSNVNAVDDSLLRVPGVQKHLSGRVSEKLSVSIPTVKFQPFPSPQSRPASPSRSSISRGVSPSRGGRPSTPPSRGASPSRIRSSSVASQSSSTTSVLSFITDYKKGKKGTNYIEDVHQIRLLHNRFLQWQFANARAEAVLYTQKVSAERILFSVWSTTLALWDSVIRKRINLQQLKLELKLTAVLNDQMAYLDDWALLEREHISSVSRAVEDLEASTLRLPVAGGAKVDIESFKVTICSAVDVMQAMGSSICSLLSRVEGMNCLISDLATVAAQEKAMLDECEALLASVAALQVEEYSIRTHFLQVKQAVEMRSMF